jgi:redox-sensitive bicupin YhaK (pirin superfamily)
MRALVNDLKPNRQIVHRGRGTTHGPITRLISPDDLGKSLKPFVFLDLFDIRAASPPIGLHPHSGIATLTYIAEGSVAYEDTTGATGLLRTGGVEWMRAGAGVWHGGGAGPDGRTRGFQLWVALPPDLELAAPLSLYQAAEDILRAGPARVLLGRHDRKTNAIEPPSDITYLAINLPAGQRWTFRPPASHEVLWIAIGKGAVEAGERLSEGEIVVFAPGHEAVTFEAVGQAEFVLGSAVPHQHPLVLGYYSVHTSAEALRAGEAQIRRIRHHLTADGRL